MTMRAWRVAALGEPAEALELTDVDTPVPGPDEVLIRVRACALNFPDVLLVRGQYQDRPPLPFTPGVELCGDVVGEDRRVMGTAVLPHGALSEYAVGKAAHLFDAPERYDDAEAAAFTIAYQTGWVGLHHRAALQPGETLLVHAAAGGVGSAAVQLGQAAGARVVGVVSSAAKTDVATQLGAHAVVDRSLYPDQREFVAALREACGPHGADVVYDPVGGAAFEASTKVVAFEGRILVVGFAGGVVTPAATNHALVKNYSIVGLYWGLYRTKRPEVVAEAAAALESMKDIRPYVSERLPLERAKDGLVALAEGRTTGRVVVEVAR